MSSEEVGIEEARKSLGDLVNKVTYTGADITLTRNGRPVARLAPLEPAMDYTLISANPGDRVPGVELADPDAPEIPGLADRPEVYAWMHEVGYGPDDPDELVYITPGHIAQPGFPVLHITV